MRITVSRAGPGDVDDLLELARSSRAFHRPWVYLPQERAAWRRYVRRARQDDMFGYLVRRSDTGELAGVVNISEVVRGVFQSAYLGFYAHASHAGGGLMSDGLRAVIRLAFRVHRLHRLEANIQPGNLRSRKLVSGLGFRKEGFSPRYLKIGGRWRDHERWAITREIWRPGTK